MTKHKFLGPGGEGNLGCIFTGRMGRGPGKSLQVRSIRGFMIDEVRAFYPFLQLGERSGIAAICKTAGFKRPVSQILALEDSPGSVR